jgi:hypothetical protein
MDDRAESHPDGPAAPRRKWAAIGCLGLLIAGLTVSAYQAVHRSPADTERGLTVLAPAGAKLTLDGARSDIPVAEGVHAFRVRPGPAALEVAAPGHGTLSRTLDIPAGYGPLMIEITAGPGGELRIGYF